MTGSEQGPVDDLRRWQESGAIWRVISCTSTRAVIALLTCDGGEEVDRLTFEDAEVLAFVGDRLSSED